MKLYDITGTMDCCLDNDIMSMSAVLVLITVAIQKNSYEIYTKIFRHKGTDACHLLSNDSEKKMHVCVCVHRERQTDTENLIKQMGQI